MKIPGVERAARVIWGYGSGATESDISRIIVRETKADLMVKLCKHIEQTLSPYGGGWTRRASTEEMNQTINLARQIQAKLLKGEADVK